MFLVLCRPPTTNCKQHDKQAVSFRDASVSLHERLSKLTKQHYGIDFS